MLLKTVNEQSVYDDFILKNNHATFLQSWQWGELQTQLGQKVFRLGLGGEELKICGQFIEKTIPHLDGKYLYCPYGPVGNLELLPELIAQIKEQYPHYWLVRVEPQQNFPTFGEITTRIQPGKTLITSLAKSEEELLAAMHPKTRYNIKVAQKHQIQIQKLDKSDSRLSTALSLIIETSKRQGFIDHPVSYYQTLTNSLPLASTYIASVQDKILSCAIMIDYDQTRTYLFGGSSDEQKNLMAPYLLHWQAMQDAKANGFTNYDWWGIETSSGKTPGFVRFKLSWGGQEIAYPRPVDVVFKPLRYLIYKLLRPLGRIF